MEREQLPVFQHRHRVLEALQRHPVVVVAGETGSGKSTQIPQFLLEKLLTGGKVAQPCDIVVTQPRRISAMSLACRVSQELGCEDGPGSKVELPDLRALMYMWWCCQHHALCSHFSRRCADIRSAWRIGLESGPACCTALLVFYSGNSSTTDTSAPWRTSL